ncbi:unnamed protein product [Dicrocoelium dendriticum]|nr:unnamed protein product [Dicrocoelium dendriticum]
MQIADVTLSIFHLFHSFNQIHIFLVFTPGCFVSDIGMLSGISDDEIRSMLSNYMDVVPPVTESTRQVLLLKLQKHMAGDLPPENIGDSSIENLPVSPPTSPRKSPRSSTQMTSGTNSDVSPNRGEVVTSEHSARKPSPILEYAARLPVYRRRSIHPNNPSLASPYSELALPHSPEESLFTRTFNQRPVVRSRDSSTSSPIKRTRRSLGLLAWCCSILWTVVTVLWSSVIAFIAWLNRGPISLRWIIVIFLVAVSLISICIHFLFDDPFYQNPVNELHRVLRP